MALATVYHQTNRDFKFFEIEDKDIRMCDYERVAFVSLNDEVRQMTIEQQLEFVFSSTNSVFSPWTEANSHFINVLQPRCRSTCVGDIIRIGGDKYAVESFGFRKVGV